MRMSTEYAATRRIAPDDARNFASQIRTKVDGSGADLIAVMLSIPRVATTGRGSGSKSGPLKLRATVADGGFRPDGTFVSWPAQHGPFAAGVSPICIRSTRCIRRRRDGVETTLYAHPRAQSPSSRGADMQKWNPTRARALAAVGVVVLVAAAIKARTLTASDHQDTPLVELSPRFDVNDVYAFPSPGNPARTVLVLGTSSPVTPAQTPSFTFGNNDQELYQIKVDNTGDAREDLVFQITFTGKAGKQKVTLRGPVKPNSVGTTNTLVGGKPIKGYTNTIITADNGIKLFAGPRDDPFFIDLEQFFRILPDRRPETGPLSTITQGPLTFRPATGANPAVDFVRGINDMAIVIELPTSMLTNVATNGRFGVWGTTSRARSN